MAHDTAVIVTAYNEADRLPATLSALAAAFPGARIVVADDGSSDGSAEVAAAHGAEVVRSERNIGKGGVATLAAQRLLPLSEAPAPGPVILLCDGDLAASADALKLLVEEVRAGRADLAVAAFAARVGGGIGMTIDAVRAGFRVREVELPLAHRATGRTLRGFLHRGRQLLDFFAVYRERRQARP
jgi:glycosyltransferase involved in cell wall biosynthesis